jgi:hypothetical protein
MHPSEKSPGKISMITASKMQEPVGVKKYKYFRQEYYLRSKDYTGIRNLYRILSL